MEKQHELNPNSVNGLSESSTRPYKEEDDDDTPVLSSYALAALKDFLAEQQSYSDPGDSEVSLVSEDWRLTQFWYDAETAKAVAEEVLTLCHGVDFRIACIACPTLYAYLKKMDPNVSVKLLEYDKRFEQYGSEYTFYDYNHPEELQSKLKHSYKVIVADPPYLGHKKWITGISWEPVHLSAPCRRFVSARKDGDAHIWDVSLKKCVVCL